MLRPQDADRLSQAHGAEAGGEFVRAAAQGGGEEARLDADHPDTEGTHLFRK